MSKSVYSIVLSDDVVKAVDLMAYQMNTSRSNLINQILAERVQFVTPEMRMKDIFSRIEKLMDERFRLIESQSDCMLAMKSPLRYKYKPTIRYSVELTKSERGNVGRLKVQFRTQSSSFMQSVEDFFTLWQELENKYLSQVFTGSVPSEYGEGRYVREFYSPAPERLTEEQTAKAIGEYISLIDRCVQHYFDEIENPQEGSQKVENEYRAYLKKGIAII